MYANKLPPRQGLVWLVEGVRLWWRNPPLITGLMIAFFLLLPLLSGLPLIGPLLAVLLMPLAWLVVLNGSRALDRGKALHTEALLFGLTASSVRFLLRIGLIYFLCNILILNIFFMFNEDVLQQLKAAGSFYQLLVDHPQMLLKFFWLGVLMIPLMMAYCFAPVLCGWWSVRPLKAFFFSFYACVQNWQPFVVLFVGGLFAGVVVPQLFVWVVAAVIPVLAGLVAVIFSLISLSVSFVVCYTSARDIFGLPPDA